jgi:hypothetical protein
MLVLCEDCGSFHRFSPLQPGCPHARRKRSGEQVVCRPAAGASSDRAAMRIVGGLNGVRIGEPS